MMGKTHTVLAAAGAFAATTAAHASPEHQAIVCAAAILTAKMPDMDRGLRIRHRGPTHSLILHAALAFAVAFWSMAAAAGILLGIGLHSIADACTRDGCELWWPFLRRKMHLLPYGYRFRTGAGGEYVFAVVVLLATAWYAVRVAG